MSTDLRAKIAEWFACRCAPAWTERQLHAPDCIEELGQDVVEAVAEWLRAEADELRRRLPGRQPEGDSYRHIEANALDLRAKRLADSLTPHPSTEEAP